MVGVREGIGYAIGLLGQYVELFDVPRIVFEIPVGRNKSPVDQL